MILSISEILKQTSEIGSRQKKIEFLRKHDHPALREVLAIYFREDIKWLIPEGPIKFAPCPDKHDQKGMLYNQIRKLHMFYEAPGYKYNMDDKKRLKLFTMLLESIDPQDAMMMNMMKDKLMPWKGITLKLIREAYPDFLGGKTN